MGNRNGQQEQQSRSLATRTQICEERCPIKNMRLSVSVSKMDSMSRADPSEPIPTSPPQVNEAPLFGCTVENSAGLPFNRSSGKPAWKAPPTCVQHELGTVSHCGTKAEPWIRRAYDPVALPNDAARIG
jgi:hypothetical protein